MTTIANIASRILSENGLAIADFAGLGTPLTLTILEYKIDDAIDYVNLQAGTTIADLTGTAESKSLVGTDSEILIVKWLSNLMLRAFKEKALQAGGLGGINVTYVLNDPDYKISMMVIEKAIERLKELPIVIANDPLPNE